MKNENNVNATMQLGYSEEAQEWESRGITFVEGNFNGFHME